jgi:hypothetical protein
MLPPHASGAELLEWYFRGYWDPIPAFSASSANRQRGDVPLWSPGLGFWGRIIGTRYQVQGDFH